MRGWAVLIAVIAVGVGVVAIAGADEPRRLQGSKPIDGEKVKNLVAFTFDDGPDYETTPTILDTLDAAGLKTTFFVVGSRFTGKGEVAEKNRALLEEEVKRGHMIGNHTWDHTDLTADSEKEAARDIDKGDQAIVNVLGERPILMRPPFGATNKDIRQMLRDRGYTTVLWSVDTEDWKAHSVDALREKTMKLILEEGGGIVLMHDTKKITAAAFPLILQDLQKENCRRIAAGADPIVPVEIDYFGSNPIPQDVADRAAASRQRVIDACKP
jgi:peptidoglycan/xylan/chitin deacetylase (PgdA/CDA1 family)